jgi:hypothetical protein
VYQSRFLLSPATVNENRRSRIPRMNPRSPPPPSDEAVTNAAFFFGCSTATMASSVNCCGSRRPSIASVLHGASSARQRRASCSNVGSPETPGASSSLPAAGLNTPRWKRFGVSS